MHVQEMYRRLTGLVVFRRLLQDPVVAACGEMLSARVRGDSGDFSAACAGFEAALFQSSDSWSCYLRETVLESENVCIRGQAVGRSSVLQESLRLPRLPPHPARPEAMEAAPWPPPLREATSSF